MRRYLSGALAALVLLVVIALILIFSGWYNVAATQPHTELGRWLLQTTMRRSVDVRADDIRPPDITDVERIRRGAHHFAEMCVVCHGAPGVERGAIGKGLRPEPPELHHAAARWTPSELFWIVKHGVRMTGMPAWGVTHNDEAIWDIVSFVALLPAMTPAEYAAYAKTAGGAKPHAHEHAGKPSGGHHEKPR